MGRSSVLGRYFLWIEQTHIDDCGPGFAICPQKDYHTLYFGEIVACCELKKLEPISKYEIGSIQRRPRIHGGSSI
jgi:hypothetical protein